jgi:phenylacetate-CoA ligase
MPVVKEIAGREEDVVTAEDGRKMVRFHGIFIDLPSVMQGQIIQNDYYHFTVKIIAKENLPAHEKQIIVDRMKLQLGKQVVISIEEVNEIPAGPNGKFKAVISNLKQ